MQEVLYIRLASQATETMPWLIWSPGQQEIIASGEITGAEALSELAEKAQTRQTIALAPGSDVLLKALSVPAKNQRAMSKAVPYMLEEELSEDVEELFFAFAKVKASGEESNCHVAVVKRELMSVWQSWLKDAGIKCQTLIPEQLLLPEQEQGWSAIALGEQIVIRQGSWQGTALDSAQWPFMADSWQQEETPVVIHRYSPLPELPVTIEQVAEPEELPLALFAQHKSVPINLLQGDFTVKTERSPSLKYWAIAASLALVALLLNIGVKGAALYQLNSQQAMVEQQIIDTYKEAFPQTKRVRVSTIRSQLKRKLSEAGSGDSGAGFLAMLAKVRGAFQQVPELQPTSLKFDRKRQELRIQAEAKDYQAFDKFKTVLEQARMEVKQGAQNNQGERVTGSLSIKG
ncbi:type II secretion system protein GspL [Thalassotalea euphylliae]|uniref:type II secretion system protein GspL n=1 Tax=Thalassotalea euphylliae TaxID=1655234 RepID=UPI0036361B7D